MDDELWSDEGLGEYFDHTHADAIKDIRRAIERKHYDEALALLDRYFNDNGDPK